MSVAAVVLLRLAASIRNTTRLDWNKLRTPSKSWNDRNELKHQVDEEKEIDPDQGSKLADDCLLVYLDVGDNIGVHTSEVPF
jgi:hypothetical protein